jgi:type III pantothenate kinase
MNAALIALLGLNFVWRGYLMPTALIFLKYLVIICGGDAESFESLVKDHIFVVPNLVLLGLNCILNHHVA